MVKEIHVNGNRGRGRPKYRWLDVMKSDSMLAGVNEEYTGDRIERILRSIIADPKKLEYKEYNIIGQNKLIRVLTVGCYNALILPNNHSISYIFIYNLDIMCSIKKWKLLIIYYFGINSNVII